MIEATGLSKSFGSVDAVANLSFVINAGEITGFLGPNGAGKSTTMRMLAGVLGSDSGTARIGGHDITASRLNAQALLGYMPETCAGFSNLTVREFLAYCAEVRGLDGAKRDEAVARVCDNTLLGPALNTAMGKLSKGWRQRAWFAQAVMHGPGALILDEPADGLDPAQKQHVRGFIRTLAQKTAIILSTHVLEEAEAVCDRCIIIANGRILADEPTKKLLDRHGRLAPAFIEITAGGDGP